MTQATQTQDGKTLYRWIVYASKTRLGIAWTATESEAVAKWISRNATHAEPACSLIEDHPIG